MGRALFSQQYITTPAVREEPEPSVDRCEKWSVWNQFDPDSEEFFKDAELEQFVDRPIHSPSEDRAHNPPHVVVLESITDSSSSSSADNDDSLSDNDSPMAIGADDPATLLAGAYTPIDWQQRFLQAGSDVRRQGRPTRIPHRAPHRAGTVRQHPNVADAYTIVRATSVPVFIPPASYRNTSTSTPTVGPPSVTAAQMQDPAPLPLPATPRSPVSRRTVSITPINIPSEPSVPSPVTPSTPSSQLTYPATNNFSPSPAPNVTPRVYTWGRVPVASSPSRDSPLTNPRARMSLSRIDTMALAQHQYIPVLDH